MGENVTSIMTVTSLGDCQTRHQAYSDYFTSESDCMRIIQEWDDLTFFQYNTLGIAGCSLVILGLIGNVLSLIVLSHSIMRSTTSAHLFALAAYDSLVLISMLLFLSLPVLSETYLDAFGYIYPFAYPFVLVSQTCSVYTTVGFTVDRYIAVCHPLKAAKWCTRGHARRSLILIALFSVLFNTPRMIEFRTVSDPDNYIRWELTAFGKNEIYRHVYLIVLHILVMIIIPFVILLILNTKLVLSVRKSRNIRTKISRQKSQENNLTAMLTMVVAVFLICQLPSILDNILGVVLTESEKIREPFPVKVNAFNNLCVITNSAVNFYMYCLFGNKFRRAFISIILKCQWSTLRLRNGSSRYNTQSSVLQSQKEQLIKSEDKKLLNNNTKTVSVGSVTKSIRY